jgi:hypothetical protein
MKPQPKLFNMTSVDRAILESTSPDDVDTFVAKYFNITLFPWQSYFIRYPCRDKLVVAGIRSGKSFASAVHLLHHAYWNPMSRILAVCITSDQARVVFQEIVAMASSPEFEHWIDGDVLFHPYPKLKLINGSEIWARSIGGPAGKADNLRGWEFDVIALDEAAYVQNVEAIRTLQGRLIGFNKVIGRPRAGIFLMTTTPTRKAAQWLYERWQLGDPASPNSNPKEYLSIRARTYDNPHLDPKIIADIERSYTERMRQQEMEGLFTNDDAFFPLDEILRCCGKYVTDNIIDASNDDIDPDFADLERRIVERLKEEHPQKFAHIDSTPEHIDLYELPPEPGRAYVAGWDIGSRAIASGRGRERNSTVGVVFDITSKPWKMVAYRFAPNLRYPDTMELIKHWHDRYNSNGATCHTRIDAVGSGDVVHQILSEQQYRIDGFKAGVESKAAILQAIKIAIEKRWLRFPYIQRIITQLQNYDVDDRHLSQDIVMAMAQAVHYAMTINGDFRERTESRTAERSSFRVAYRGLFSNSGTSRPYRQFPTLHRTRRR